MIKKVGSRQFAVGSFRTEQVAGRPDIAKRYRAFFEMPDTAPLSPAYHCASKQALSRRSRSYRHFGQRNVVFPRTSSLVSGNERIANCRKFGRVRPTHHHSRIIDLLHKQKHHHRIPRCFANANQHQTQEPVNPQPSGGDAQGIADHRQPGQQQNRCAPTAKPFHGLRRGTGYEERVTRKNPLFRQLRRVRPTHPLPRITDVAVRRTHTTRCWTGLMLLFLVTRDKRDANRDQPADKPRRHPAQGIAHRRHGQQPPELLSLRPGQIGQYGLGAAGQ